MPILENDQDGSQHVGMNDATKVGSESSDGKEQTIDEDIVHDDSEAHILEQSQVNFIRTVFEVFEEISETIHKKKQTKKQKP